MSDLEKYLDELVAAALKEDVGDGDRTTAYLVEKGLKGIARITAKEDLVLAVIRAIPLRPFSTR